jgi:hypothetical protein
MSAIKMMPRLTPSARTTIRDPSHIQDICPSEPVKTEAHTFLARRVAWLDEQGVKAG